MVILLSLEHTQAMSENAKQIKSKFKMGLVIYYPGIHWPSGTYNKRKSITRKLLKHSNAVGWLWKA